MRREGIGTFKARTAVGRQPTEVAGGLGGSATYRGYRGLRREGIGTFKARTAVGRQPTEIKSV